MSMDKLQEKIRKTKNPMVLHFSGFNACMPPHILENAQSVPAACNMFCSSLLEGLSAQIPAVRFSFQNFALMGPEGLKILSQLLSEAKKQGYYILLDGPESLSEQDAVWAAERLFREDCPWFFDGLVISSYIGSDGIRPYVDKMKYCDKDLFAVVRTANRTAPELQDLLSGSRLMHMANADIVNRFSPEYMGRGGYSRVGVLAGASSADSLRLLRSKYKQMFLLLDGCDYPNANAKNCSYAFDALGRGAVACAGHSITGAWQQAQTDGSDYLQQAEEAVQRLKKNLTRYITIL